MKIDQLDMNAPKSEWEIEKLKRMLKEANVPFDEEEKEYALSVVYYPKRDESLCEEAEVKILAHQNRNDTLLYINASKTIFAEDWDSNGMYYHIHGVGAEELSAEDIFPILWADWLWRCERGDGDES